MFIPLRDENSLKSIPFQYVTVGLIAINVLVFLLEVSGLSEAAVASFGVTPRELFGSDFLAPQDSAWPVDGLDIGEPTTLLTYMFFHADVFHLARQHAVPLGVRRQRRGRHGPRALPRLLPGLRRVRRPVSRGGCMPDSDLPLIGASGAVAGVIAAYLMLHPRVSVWVLAFKVIPLRITAGLVLGSVDRVLQVVMVAMPRPGPVAWWAHIGGLIAGAVLIVFMRRPGVPLFDEGTRLT